MVRRAKELEERDQLRELAVERAQQSRDAVQRQRRDVPLRNVMAGRQRNDEAGEEDAGGGARCRVEGRGGQCGADQEGSCRRDDEGAI